MKSVVDSWASSLGLAPRALFPRLVDNSLVHYAMLDGRRGSFALSVGEDSGPSIDDSRNWQWSADLAHHVVISANEVQVRSGRTSSPRRFVRRTVEGELDAFLRYLQADHSDQLPDLISFLVGEFIQLWSSLPRESSGNLALAAFLAAINTAGSDHAETLLDPNSRVKYSKALGFSDDVIEQLSELQSDILVRSSRMQERTPVNLRLVPHLVIRHAGGRLFQEAHSILESAQLGLFGENVVRAVPAISPSGAYFTPVPIARILSEAAIAAMEELSDHIVVADYACGSGVFLVEAIHVLEQRGYRGRVTIVGRDISEAAITMATVALTAAAVDVGWLMTIAIDVCLGDVLSQADLPEADIILMNPPFRSWERMDSEERAWTGKQLDGIVKGRPDISVGIIEKSLSCLKQGGVLGTLLPAGVLASEGMARWRTSLLERFLPRVVAVLGEHGLFRHALVNIGAIVVQKIDPHYPIGQQGSLVTAWASSDEGAASAAIRALRRDLNYANAPTETATDLWSIKRTSRRAWSLRPSWLPGPSHLGSLLDDIRKSVVDRVEDIFNVRQAIRTGANDVFLLTLEQYNALPLPERAFFVPAVVTQSFSDGGIGSTHFLFWPNDAWTEWIDVEKSVPIYAKLYLQPSEPLLRARRGVDDRKWWKLTRARFWTQNREPRLLSKRFGLYPAFARDLDGHLAPVQANAWIPKERITTGRNKEEICGVVTAYWWLLNSRVAVALLREFCPNVAGGQLDLENKYVRHMPLPDIPSRLTEDALLQSHAAAMHIKYQLCLPPVDICDEFAALAYGTRTNDWQHSIATLA